MLPHSAMDPGDSKYFAEKKFSQEEIERLKKTKTVFFLQKKDEELQDEFEKAIKLVWKFTDIEVASYDDFGNFPSEQYSYFLIEGYNVSTGKSNYTHLFLTLKLFFNEKTKKGKSVENSLNYCRIDLFSDFKTMDMAVKENSKTVIDKIYQYAIR